MNLILIPVIVFAVALILSVLAFTCEIISSISIHDTVCYFKIKCHTGVLQFYSITSKFSRNLVNTMTTLIYYCRICIYGCQIICTKCSTQK